MKRLIPFLFVIATCVIWVHGQQYALKSPSVNSVIEGRGYIMQFAPPAMAAYVNAGSGWVPLTGTGSTGQLPFSPPAAALYVLNGSNAWIPWTGAGGGGGTGTVTSFSCVTANGVSCSVATATTTPAATFTLGAITPTSVAATGSVAGTSGIFGTPSAGAIAALPSGAHGLSCDESATAGVPATGVDYIRCKSDHTIVASVNGGAEAQLFPSTGGGTGSGFSISFGGSNQVTGLATQYAALNGAAAGPVSSAQAASILTTGCTASHLSVVTFGTQPIDGSLVITLVAINPTTVSTIVPTAITLTIAASGGSAGGSLFTDATHTVATTPNTIYQYQMQNNSVSSSIVILSLGMSCN